MIKKIISVFVVLFFVNTILVAGNVTTENIVFKGSSVTFNAENFADTINSVIVSIKSSEKINIHAVKINLKDGKGSVETSFENSGRYYYSYNNLKDSTIRVIPGYYSIIPPLLAIFLALVIRQVLISLFAGIYVGALIIYDFNPFIAFLRLADRYILHSLADEGHIYIVLFTLMIGGVVGVISFNGGTAGMANLITRLARTRRSGMVSSWLLGLFIFFDDYANSLIIGNMMRPMMDKLKISRAKLAYIVDSTAAPIASLVIISTWIGYELGLIQDGLTRIGYADSAYTVFLQTLPYRFYPIAALFFVFIVSYTQRDFGPMYKAEKDAFEGKTGEAEIENNETTTRIQMKMDGKWYYGLFPILIILFGTIAGLFYTGINALEAKGATEFGLQEIISASDSYLSLLWASLAAGTVGILMTLLGQREKLNTAVDSWIGGVQSMLYACIILVFAWGISMITNEMKTADFVVSIISGSFDPRLLPAAVFLICGVISFSTGTSWGTMAIVMPIVIPLAASMTEAVPGADLHLIIVGVVSSVLAGSVIGDHCSPIADTTILSSMASGCNHIEHVKTQLPYAVVVGSVAIMLGDIPTAYGLSPYISIVLILITLYFILRLLGKKVG